MGESVEKTFRDSFQQDFDLSSMTSEAQSYLKGLGAQQKDDFASTIGGYFGHESQEFIATESARQLARALSARKPPEVELSFLQQEWQKIVVDFYHNNFWGQVPQKNKPFPILSEEQKRVRELAPYIWTAFQAWIVMKLVISYFGQEAADNPDDSHWFLYLAIGFSFGSLIFFAWRKSKKGE